MSLQQNNINKFPKHIQHVRLQKEEDEEQWISGEELCTEGSSDEENTNDIKKKIKNKPFSVPPKELIQIKNSSSSSTSLSTRESDDENIDGSETSQKSPTHWRPKRGSIKLPNIEETHFKLQEIQNDRLNVEYEYQEAINILKLCENELASNEYTNFNYSINDIDIVSNLDNDLLKVEQMLEDCKKDRLHFQTNVYKILRSYSNTELEVNNTKKFHNVFQIKSEAQIDNTACKTNINLKVKPLWKRKSKYIPHRKRKMTDNLNEDDKTRLKNLLSDIEITEIDDSEVKNDEEEENNLDVDLNYNAFKATEDELRNLEEIEKKLKTLQETSDDADLKGKSSEEIRSIDEENREWKTYKKLIEGRFKRINEKINKLHEDDKPTVTEDVQNT